MPTTMAGHRRAAAAAVALATLLAPGANALVTPNFQPRAASVARTSSSRHGAALTMRASGPMSPQVGNGIVGIDGFPLDPNQRYASEGLVASTGKLASELVSNGAEGLQNAMKDPNNEYPINQALQKIENDIMTLDQVVGNRAQISTLEFGVLATTTLTALFSPFLLATKVVEVLVPSMAALSAAVGISAEYVGKVSVANGKEIAATALMAAAEAEVGLASAERAKAVIPLSVGISATATAFALLAPALLEDLGVRYGVILVTELYLVPPVFSVLAAAIAGLAAQETTALARRASSIGNRRFAQANSIGNSWLSASEQVTKTSFQIGSKWSNFAWATLPAPLLGALCPGPISFKCIVCAATAAAQAAYYLASAEYELARTMDAVAVKTRSAALADTYANQGARSGAILPFTSALAALCAAATAAVVEVLPLLPSIELEAAVGGIFPVLGALFASAASVSKARCEVDAAAASQAADSFADRDNKDREVEYQNLEPVRGVFNLIKLTARAIKRVAGTVFSKINPFGRNNNSPYAY